MSTFKIEGGFAGLAASTRVRLARNLKGYPYRGLTAGQYKEIADKIWNALQTAPAIAADFTMTEIRPRSAEGAALVEKHLISPEGYPYRGLTAGQYKEIADKIWNALQTAPAIAADFTMTEIRPRSAEGAALVEKHLISPELAQSGGWLIASRDGGVAIMVGEEDHMRLQVIGSGLCPKECMAEARRLAALIEGQVPMDFNETLGYLTGEEDHMRLQVIGSGLCPKECMAEARRLAALIEGQVPMDFNETLGYLTACPSNLGTGLRASIMLHLPLLGGAGRMQDVIAAAGRQGFTVRGAYGEGSKAVGGFYQLSNQVTLGRQGFTVRGAYGEGSKAVGGFYQLSNQVTLGMSEDAIVEQLVTLATDVIGQEKQLREQLRSQNETALADRICRAAGVLQTARLIETGEAIECLSNIGQEKQLREQLRSQNETALADRICRAAGVLQTARLIETGEAIECLSNVLIGLQMGYLAGVSPTEVCALEQAIRPAVLGGTPAERDKKRAALLREMARKLEIKES